MSGALRALTISGRGPKRDGRSGGTGRINQELAKLSLSPFNPEFGPAPEFTRTEFGPAPQFVAPKRPEFRTERGIPNVSELDAAIARIRGRETGTSAGELAGLEGLFEAADPTSRLAAVRKQLETVIGPEALSKAIAGGFGRGPAAAEATAKAGASLSLPILESSFAAKSVANQFKVALEQARFGREQSQQRELFESVLNKVNAGISIESLNAQERQVLAQFNLSAAGQESQFNLTSSGTRAQFNLAQAGAESQFDLSAAGLQSEREIARSNIGLSTQDRTFNLLDQLRVIREGNLNRAAAAANRPIQNLRAKGGGGGGGLSAPPGVTDLQRAQTSLLNQQSNAIRVASIRAGKQQFSPVAATPGVLTGGINDPRGTGAVGGPSTAGSGVIFRGGKIINAPSISAVASKVPSKRLTGLGPQVFA